MRLSDAVSHADLTIYPEVGLVVFLAVFAAIVWRVFRRSASHELRHAGALPLDDSPTVDAPGDACALRQPEPLPSMTQVSKP